MRRDWVIEVDDREKHPLLFPAHLPMHDGTTRCTVSLHTVRTRMAHADYRLSTDPLGVVIERKAALGEITTNLFASSSRARFVAHLAWMRDSCRHPYLLYEGTPAALLSSTPQPGQPSGSEALDTLLCLMLEYRVTPLFLPSDSLAHRRATGEYAARLLIRGETHGSRTHRSDLQSPPGP